MADTQTSHNATVDDLERWGLVKTRALEARACLAFSLFRANDIEPILIKGIAVGRYYPQERFRDSIDMDLAVSGSEFISAREIVRSDEASGLAIDLHDELRHLDTVPWADLMAHSQIIEFSLGSIRVLCPEDHLRILCVHWLTDGGSNKERLLDIYYAVENRPNDFDWNRFLDPVDSKRRRWLTCTIGLTHRYLGLDLTGTPIENEAKDIPTWLTKAVEKEWQSKTPFWPLSASTSDPKLFLAQLRKRLPPNPVTATVLVNGSFNAKTRVFYQIRTSIARIGPSIVNIFKALIGKWK